MRRLQQAIGPCADDVSRGDQLRVVLELVGEHELAMDLALVESDAAIRAATRGLPLADFECPTCLQIGSHLTGCHRG